MTTYVFKVYFNILQETGISPVGIKIEPIEFTKIAITKETGELTNNQIEVIKTKLKNFLNNKLNLTSTYIVLDAIIK